MNLKQGVFVVSLDFELYWGVRDKLNIEQYGDNLLGVRKAIPEILRVFENSNIHATWATVGFLFFKLTILNLLDYNMELDKNLISCIIYKNQVCSL